MGQQMGPMLFSMGGKLIGGFVGGPIGGAIGGLAGGLIGSLIFNRQKKPLIPDLNMMNSSYGNPIPILWGTARMPGTIVWMSDVQVKEHGIGKGQMGKPTSYWQNVSVGFCEGYAELVKLFLDGKLFLDNTTDHQELTKDRFALREYPGSETQLPDFLYQQWCTQKVHLGNRAAPAQRGLAHLIFDKIDLAHFGNRFPQTSAVYSTNVQTHTVFKKLIRWSADVSPDHGVWSYGIGNGTAVDWTRNVAYQLSFDGTIRVYDLGTQQCIMAKTNAQLGVFFQHLADFGEHGLSLSGICCGLSTNLYLFGSQTNVVGGIGTTAYVWIINPDTLTVQDELVFPMAYADQFFQMICFTMNTVEGNFEMLFGNTLFFSNGPPVVGSSFVMEPVSGVVGRVATTWMGAFAQVQHCVGLSDPFTGVTDLWFMSGSALFDSTFSISIQRCILTGTDGTQLAAEGQPDALNTWTLHPEDFGIATADILVSEIGSMVYDAGDDSLIILNQSFAYRSGHTGPAGSLSFKWNKDAGIIWIVRNGSAPGSWPGSAPQWPMLNSNFDRGKIGGSIGFHPNIGVVDTSTGEVSVSPVSAADGNRGAAAVTGNIHYDSYSHSFVYTDAYGGNVELYIAYLQRKIGVEVPVASIILDLCSRVGVDVSMVDVSLVTDTTVGYIIREGSKSAGAAIADLCHVYLLDQVESDYKLKFIPRGQPSVVTIPQADLASTDASDAGKYWVPKRAMEQEMPLHLNVKYEDPNLDYQPGSAYARRVALPVPTVYSKRRQTMDLPIVATGLEARHIAEKLLFTMWAERDTYETVLSPKYLWLDPGDTATVAMDNGDSYSVRIEDHEVGADFSMRLRTASEDLTTYSGNTSPAALFGAAPQTIVSNPFGQILLFNAPLLQDIDDTAGTSSRIYFAAGALTSEWLGGAIYNSLDGATWTALTTIQGAANWGYASSALGDTPAGFATDYTNTVDVAWAIGVTVPSSCSYLDLMNGVNAAQLGDEIIQFQTITDNGDGTFRLSALARGRRGTEWATGTHRSGEHLIMLELGRLGSYRLPLAQINQSELWKLLPFGRFLDQVTSTNFTYTGNDLKPYAPVILKRAVSGSDLVATWHRRTRIGGLLQNGSDTVPLGEETEAYEAYVLPNAGARATFSPTNPATYTRKFAGLTTASLTYTAAQMTTDSFTPATDTLYLAVYQLSAAIGRGFQGYDALPAH